MVYDEGSELFWVHIVFEFCAFRGKIAPHTSGIVPAFMILSGACVSTTVPAKNSLLGQVSCKKTHNSDRNGSHNFENVTDLSLKS